MLESIGYGAWVLHALIWLPILGIGLVLWAEEEAAKNPIVVINPEISEREGHITWEEGCLSVPDYTANVERDAKIEHQTGKLGEVSMGGGIDQDAGVFLSQQLGLGSRGYAGGYLSSQDPRPQFQRVSLDLLSFDASRLDLVEERVLGALRRRVACALAVAVDDPVVVDREELIV